MRYTISFTYKGIQECLTMGGTIKECLDFIDNSYPGAEILTVKKEGA